MEYFTKDLSVKENDYQPVLNKDEKKEAVSEFKKAEDVKTVLQYNTDENSLQEQNIEFEASSLETVEDNNEKKSIKEKGNDASSDRIQNKHNQKKYRSNYPDGSYEVIITDENGLLFKTEIYSPKGNLLSYTSFEYDENGELIKAETCKANGEVISIDEYQDRKLIKTTFPGEDAKPALIEYIYDENGFTSQSIGKDKDGNIISVSEFENGCIKKTTFTEEDAVPAAIEYSYTIDNELKSITNFDKDGNIIDQIGYNENTPSFVRDSNWNIIYTFQ